MLGAHDRLAASMGHVKWCQTCQFLPLQAGTRLRSVLLRPPTVLSTSAFSRRNLRRRRRSSRLDQLIAHPVGVVAAAHDEPRTRTIVAIRSTARMGSGGARTRTGATCSPATLLLLSSLLGLSAGFQGGRPIGGLMGRKGVPWLRETPTGSPTCCQYNGFSGEDVHSSTFTVEPELSPAHRGAATAAGSPCVKTSDVLSLDSVRGSLIRQEETIIFALIERAQFRRNPAIYTDKTFKLHKEGVAEMFDRDSSFLEYMLCETEKLHARVRRFMSPEEVPFFPSFHPEPILPKLDFPQILAPNTVNVNDQVLARYVSEVVPVVCEAGDDEQHGSSVICDINALQALSRRVHLGKFVAESKFQGDGGTYRALCRVGDAAGVNELLTSKPVEARVLQRAFDKASTYGKDIDSLAGGGAPAAEAPTGGFKVDPAMISRIYRDLIIPLTKDVEIMYLFERTGYPCPSLEGLHGDLHA